MSDYKYNDYTLPELPAWDKTTYPYAMIFLVRSASLMYHLVCHSNPVTVRNVDGVDLFGYEVGTEVYDYTYSFINGDTGWVDKGDVTPTPGSDNVIWHYYDAGIEWVWCNHDIRNESGTVVYAATEPVPIEPEEPETPKFDLRSWLTGYALGLAGKPLPFSKEPVAYLYNGVRLPDINEVWDKAAYPYCYIAEHGTAYGLWCSAYAHYGVYDEADGDYDLFTSTAGKYRFFGCLSGKLIWEYLGDGEREADYHYSAVSHIVWTSADILGTDGTIALATSEPVPVYE